MRAGDEHGRRGGVVDGVGQVVEDQAVRRLKHSAGIVRVMPVEAQHGVEVHDPAALHFGDLAEADLDRGRVDAAPFGGAADGP